MALPVVQQCRSRFATSYMRDVIWADYFTSAAKIPSGNGFCVCMAGLAGFQVWHVLQSTILGGLSPCPPLFFRCRGQHLFGSSRRKALGGGAVAAWRSFAAPCHRYVAARHENEKTEHAAADDAPRGGGLVYCTRSSFTKSFYLCKDFIG